MSLCFLHCPFRLSRSKSFHTPINVIFHPNTPRESCSKVEKGGGNTLGLALKAREKKIK